MTQAAAAGSSGARDPMASVAKTGLAASRIDSAERIVGVSGARRVSPHADIGLRVKPSESKRISGDDDDLARVAEGHLRDRRGERGVEEASVAEVPHEPDRGRAGETIDADDLVVPGETDDDGASHPAAAAGDGDAHQPPRSFLSGSLRTNRGGSPRYSKYATSFL